MNLHLTNYYLHLTSSGSEPYSRQCIVPAIHMFCKFGRGSLLNLFVLVWSSEYISMVDFEHQISR